MDHDSRIRISIPPGELIDRITILRIAPFIADLLTINACLWDVEESLRDLAAGSRIIEEKS